MENNITKRTIECKCCEFPEYGNPTFFYKDKLSGDIFIFDAESCVYKLINTDNKNVSIDIKRSLEDEIKQSQSTGAGGMNIKDSGEREIMSTGSQRDTQTGKPRPELIPVSTLTKLAIHYGNGSKKYDAWNWSKGQSISRYMASFGRHKDKWSMGLTDEPHLIAMIWNLISIDYTLDAIKCGMLPAELDDRHASQKEGNPLGKMMEELIEQNIKYQNEKDI